MKGRCVRADDAAAFVAGEADGGFAEHLAGCAECREVVAATQRVRQRLQALPRATVSRDLGRGIRERIHQEAKQARWLRIAAMAAAVTICAGIAALTFPRRQPANLVQSGAARAVDWLCAQQEPDGSWNAKKWGGQERFQIALTALPMLAVEASGTASPARTAAVRKSADWLRGQQRADGTFGAEFSGAPYNRSIATLALIRAADWEKEPRHEEAVSRALGALLARQTREGGWGYEFSARADRSITEWHVEALEAAAERGHAQVPAQLARAQQWLAAHPETRGRTEEPADSPSETLPPPRAAELDFYGAYFLTARLQAQGDPSSRERLAGLRHTLLMRQITGGAEAGTWSPDDRWGRAGGRLYSTALAAMTLRGR